MAFDIVFKNGQVVTPSGIHGADLAVSGGKIAKLGTINEKGDREIDATGKFLLPGAIDIHVHFRDPGFPEKGDFETESRAAAAGGVTTVLDMPNTNPPTLTIAALEEKRGIAGKKSLVNFGLFLGCDGVNISEIKKAAFDPANCDLSCDLLL